MNNELSHFHNLIGENTVKAVLEQNKLRHAFWETNSPEALIRMIDEETEELRVAVELAIKTDYSPLDVAGEIADVLIFGSNYCARTKKTLQESPKSVQKSLAYALEICELTGFDPRLCVLQKLLRNVIKYPQSICNNGYNASEAIVISKNQYLDWGGDERFNQEYIKLIEDSNPNNLFMMLNQLGENDQAEFMSIMKFLEQCIAE